MLNNLKALIFVLVIAGIVFRIARPICINFMPEATFRHRRNIWLALTIVAFLSPTFWIFAGFEFAVLVWALRRDPHPLALYALVTFAIPDVHLFIPVPLIGQFFDLSQYRILSLAILIPVACRSSSTSGIAKRKPTGADFLLVVFLLLQVATVFQYETMTTSMRRAFLLFLDILVVFHAFSRISSKSHLADVLASFWLACLIMAAVGIVETARGWLLYTGLDDLWGAPRFDAYLLRGDSLRAQASSGHALNLGYQLSIGLGFYIYLRSRGASAATNMAVFLLLCAGIIVSYSRGAWVTAAVIVAVAFAARPQAARRMLGPIVAAVVAFTVMYATPLKELILDRLPFVGTSDQNTIEYRRQLAETSWMLIKQNPWFGDPFVSLRMESLRQGQGIIDIVNGYIYTALFNGLVGLALWSLVLAMCLGAALRALFRTRQVDPDFAALGATLVACMIGTLVFIAAAGSSTTTYILCGLLTSFACLCGAGLARSSTDQASYLAQHQPV